IGFTPTREQVAEQVATFWLRAMCPDANQTDLADLLSLVVGAPVSASFGALLVVHIVAGVTCVITGAVALLSRKARGRHPSFGEAYYWSLVSCSRQRRAWQQYAGPRLPTCSCSAASPSALVRSDIPRTSA